MCHMAIPVKLLQKAKINGSTVNVCCIYMYVYSEKYIYHFCRFFLTQMQYYAKLNCSVENFNQIFKDIETGAVRWKLLLTLTTDKSWHAS